MLLTFESFKKNNHPSTLVKNHLIKQSKGKSSPCPTPLKNLSSSPTVHGIPGRWVPSTQLEHKPWRREVLIYQLFGVNKTRFETI